MDIQLVRNKKAVHSCHAKYAKYGGVVITRDNFRDLVNKKSEWTKVVAERILMPTFIGENYLMWPHDPMGRHGPNLDQFLQ